MRPATSSSKKDRTGQAEMQIYFWPNMASDATPLHYFVVAYGMRPKKVQTPRGNANTPA